AAIPAGHRTAPGEGTARSAPRCAADPGSRTAGDAISRARQDRTRAARPGGRRLSLAAGRTARLAVRAAAEDARAGVPQTARTGLGRARTPTRRITSGARNLPLPRRATVGNLLHVDRRAEIVVAPRRDVFGHGRKGDH